MKIGKSRNAFNEENCRGFSNKGDWDIGKEVYYHYWWHETTPLLYVGNWRL